MTPGEALRDPKSRDLAVEQGLHIARLDAEPAYGDLDNFRITIARQADAGTSIMSCLTRPAKVAALTMSSMDGPSTTSARSAWHASARGRFLPSAREGRRPCVWPAHS